MPRPAKTSDRPPASRRPLSRAYGATLGIALPTFPSSGYPSISRVIETAQVAEEHGFERAWAWDHIVWHRPQLDCVVSCAAVLAETSSISVGPGVMQLPLRPPLLIANQVGSMASAYPGRVHFGVGSGQGQAEFEALGVDFNPRWQTTRAGLETVIARWESGPSCGGLEPSAMPSIWVGGRSRRALTLAAEQGGWIPVFARPDQIRAGKSEIAKQRKGVSDSSIRLGAVVPVGPLGDVATGQRWLAKLFGLPSYPKSLVLGGSSGDVAVDLSEFIDAGVNHACLVVADDDPIPTMVWLRKVLSDAGAFVESRT